MLGSGTHGIVVEAMDRVLGRRVALKVLTAERDLESARLLREARALAAVSHPAVVEVFGVGNNADGALDAVFGILPSTTSGRSGYIVLELVDGQTLSQWQSSKKRTRNEIVDVYLDAGEGLAAAHARGVVHRDFKPSNVMVDRDGRARVVDFGLACPERGSRELQTPLVAGRLDSATRQLCRSLALPSPYTAVAATLTGSRECWGTLAYMAPEQMTSSRVDARADQFAFCVSLWEALVGERPFPSRDALERVASICAGPPEVEPARMESRLRAVLSRGLAAHPCRRFASMHELLDAVRAAIKPERCPATRTAAATLFGLALGAVAYVVFPRPDHETVVRAAVAAEPNPGNEGTSPADFPHH